jgi:hypothetical protein
MYISVMACIVYAEWGEWKGRGSGAGGNSLQYNKHRNVVIVTSRTKLVQHSNRLLLKRRKKRREEKRERL